MLLKKLKTKLLYYQHPHELITSQRLHIKWGLGFNICIWGRHRHSIYSSYYTMQPFFAASVTIAIWNLFGWWFEICHTLDCKLHDDRILSCCWLVFYNHQLTQSLMCSRYKINILTQMVLTHLISVFLLKLGLYISQ